MGDGRAHDGQAIRLQILSVYIVDGVRVIGYDNAEGRGDHRHYRETERPYLFKGRSQLAADFYDDIEKYKRGEES